VLAGERWPGTGRKEKERKNGQQDKLTVSKYSIVKKYILNLQKTKLGTRKDAI
jgi:hypothetical protein